MHLLVADDERVIRNGIAKMASQYQHSFSSIRTAYDGLHALELINEYVPDILFVDIHMPKMNGMELCKRINKQYRNIIMVVISGYDDFEYAQTCMSYGVNRYLLKPITTKDVQKVMDDILTAHSYPSVFLLECEDWVKRIEEHLWLLQWDEIEKCVLQWEEDLSTRMNVFQIRNLLNDCMKMLIRRLGERQFTPISPIEEMKSYVDYESPFGHFRAQLRQVGNDLVKWRNGNIKDPLETAKSYIDHHLSEELTLESVAEVIGMSTSYFSAFFKNMTNETFVQYRTKKRIEKAKRQLAVPYIRIVDIAAEVGYEDYPHFSKVFKTVTGYTPSAYRKKLGIK
ncbi:response regulator transcription factor [Bacillus sp. SD088]|uniref:response regulator transcription factor n=1 Tax=Bacillus sp. SD088 TaxID=2782012 RepID=UPI001A95A0AB|nr:response regulator [Bacillus sp. SD088]MBO0993279.1 response regulator [Bacillus sp. SD088]